MNNKEMNLEHNEKQEITKKTKSFNIYKLFTFILAAVLLIVLGILLRNWIVENRAEKEYDDLAAQVNRLQGELNNNSNTVPQNLPNTEEILDTEQVTEVPEDTQATEEVPDILDAMGVEIPQKNMDWAAIQEVNEDIYAWICIPGTEVDYPILQHPTDDTYYLNYNMNGTRGYPGCIYTERINRKDFTDFNTLVYGHNMRNDSMFASLHNFEEHVFFENCPYVFIYVEDKVLVYEIFAAYVSGNEHILYHYDFSTALGRQAYLEGVLKNNQGNAQFRDAELAMDSHILTLSTCIQGKPQNRYLVQAVLLNEEALEE